MKSECFSGFDLILPDHEIKQKIINRIDTYEKVSFKKKRKAIEIVPAFSVILLIAGIFVWQHIYYNLVSSTSDFKIVVHKPIAFPFSAKSAGSIAIAPSEEDLYSFANTELYGQVEGFEWVILNKQKDPNLQYMSIVSVKVLNSYRGDIKPGETIKILLPVSISGTGDGSMVEDNENACRLKKGSEAFFFIKKYGEEDTVMNGTSPMLTKDICGYGVGWGNQYIVPNENGKFNYPFAAGQLSYQDMEQIIKNKTK